MEGDHLKPGIGFVAMGYMGSQVTVFNRTRQKAQEMGKRGAQVAHTARDLAAGCQIVMV